MLVLTRKLNQSIIINSPSLGEMEVFVVEVRGDQVRLGVAAPKNVPVHRAEVYRQIQAENESASKTPATGAASTVGKTLDEIRRMQK